jgi:hypothetical protein
LSAPRAATEQEGQGDHEHDGDTGHHGRVLRRLLGLVDQLGDLGGFGLDVGGCDAHVLVNLHPMSPATAPVVSTRETAGKDHPPFALRQELAVERVGASPPKSAATANTNPAASAETGESPELLGRFHRLLAQVLLRHVDEFGDELGQFLGIGHRRESVVIRRRSRPPD